MKILIHDYAGHPFQVNLSSELSKRGFDILHVYFGADKGPKGNMESDEVKFFPVFTKNSYSKSNFIKRRFGDIDYGNRVAKLIEEFKPDIVLSGNTPTEAQQKILKASKRQNSSFIFWCQDFYSIAAKVILEKKIPLIGHFIGKYYSVLEKNQMRLSDHIIVITEKFLAQIRDWKIPKEKVSVIENWGPLEEIKMFKKDNPWSIKNNLDPSRIRGLYTGTLALKHNPNHLLVSARNNPNIEILVIGFGVGFDYLSSIKDKPKNLVLMPLQPFKDYSEVLSSADFCIAVIEKEAGKFSTPSKTLSYLCAGKPILLASPKENLAAEIIMKSRSGIVVNPDNIQGFSDALSELVSNNGRMIDFGKNARKYAEDNFDINKIADNFEKIFKKILNKNV